MLDKICAIVISYRFILFIKSCNRLCYNKVKHAFIMEESHATIANKQYDLYVECSIIIHEYD